MVSHNSTRWVNPRQIPDHGDCISLRSRVLPTPRKCCETRLVWDNNGRRSGHHQTNSRTPGKVQMEFRMSSRSHKNHLSWVETRMSEYDVWIGNAHVSPLIINQLQTTELDVVSFSSTTGRGWCSVHSLRASSIFWSPFSSGSQRSCSLETTSICCLMWSESA